MIVPCFITHANIVCISMDNTCSFIVSSLVNHNMLRHAPYMYFFMSMNADYISYLGSDS